MTNTHQHWEKIYQTKPHETLSWHQSRATISRDWIVKFAHKNALILDVGAGVSVLVDDLLHAGFCHISLLELSETALKTTKKRLGILAETVHFYRTNVLDFEAKNQVDWWHDRAVFHFLTDEKDQQIYLEKLKKTLKVGGYFLLATFVPNGVTQCSELNIVAYDLDRISDFLGADFKIITTKIEKHPHPNGSQQLFNYFLFQRLK